MARVGITFEDLLKASMASHHVEQKETIKNIVLLVKNALKYFTAANHELPNYTRLSSANNFLGRNETTATRPINSRILSSFTFFKQRPTQLRSLALEYVFLAAYNRFVTILSTFWR